MMKKSLFFAAGAALLALSACATPFNARVSRFSQMEAPAGQTFVVQSRDPRLQGGLEFNHYAGFVAANMVREGYRPATSAATADLIVNMAYNVDTGREKVVSDPFRGGYGYGFGSPWQRRSYFYGFHDPFFDNNVSSYTLYTSELDLDIERRLTGERLFEGTARAQSRTDRLQQIVPNLVEAMFTGFPGNSGETIKITIAPEPR
ncbi:DUF4136 domain-containing protein [Hephaestia sp. GCM10023244]|uniref:DUF4136 domain-containing protein n=1 Tax=unclassified Hephaestia TaxID=2631281 RepID=UPI002076E1A0|nr:DUF4136 domain-containing protein [Hephaestia sp. MAHUQ-44]MCM8729955.1 DUF4136 domain-containing protein [Hephaestia sp. MAHUQ-44]